MDYKLSHTDIKNETNSRIEFLLKQFSMALAAGWLLAINIRLVFFPEYVAGVTLSLLTALAIGALLLAVAWREVSRARYLWQFGLLFLGLCQFAAIAFFSGAAALWQLPMVAALCSLAGIFAIRLFEKGRSSQPIKSWRLYSSIAVAIAVIMLIGGVTTLAAEGQSIQAHIVLRTIFVALCIYLCWFGAIYFSARGFYKEEIQKIVILIVTVLHYVIYTGIIYKFNHFINKYSLIKMPEDFPANNVYINTIYILAAILLWSSNSKITNFVIQFFGIFLSLLISLNNMLVMVPSLALIGLLPLAVSYRNIYHASGYWVAVLVMPLLFLTEALPFVAMNMLSSTIIFFGSYWISNNVIGHININNEKHIKEKNSIIINLYQKNIGKIIFISFIIIIIGVSFIITNHRNALNISNQRVNYTILHLTDRIESQISFDTKMLASVAAADPNVFYDNSSFQNKYLDFKQSLDPNYESKLKPREKSINFIEMPCHRDNELSSNVNYYVNSKYILYQVWVFHNERNGIKYCQAIAEIEVNLDRFMTKIAKPYLNDYHVRLVTKRAADKKTAYEILWTSSPLVDFDYDTLSKEIELTEENGNRVVARIDVMPRQSIWYMGLAARIQGLTISAILLACLFIWIHFNISRNAKNREKLIENEGLRNAMIEGSSLPIIATNTDGLITIFNGSAERLLGYSSCELVGKATPSVFFEATKRKDPAIVNAQNFECPFIPDWQNSNQSSAGEASTAFDCLYVKKNGEKIPVSLHFSTMCNEEQEVVAHLCFLQDMTKAKALERARTQFIANISHELRSPLNVILGYASLLEHAQLPETERKKALRLKLASQMLYNLVSDVLDWSKIEAGQIEFNNEPFSLRELCEALTLITEEQVQSKGLDLQFKFQRGLPDIFFGDPTRIQQILYNLIGNAIKFTEQGQITVNIQKLVSKNAENIRIRIEVRDTGIGISKEHQPYLFDRFRQVQEGATRRYKGTGLGLAIVKELAEYMSGKVGVKSKPGAGSAFFVELELGRCEDGVPVTIDDSDGTLDTEWACFAGKHILLVDDADTALDLAEWLLHSKIEKVTICKNGQEALDWMAINAAPNLVLMDIQMPVMNGITAVAKMRSNPDLEKIPVIAITADANKQTIEEARSVGVNNYITKPFKPEKLNDIIKQLLSQIG